MTDLKKAMDRVVHESPTHGPVLVAELVRLLEEDARHTHEIEMFLRGGPTALDVAEAHRENAERDLRAAREKLQIAEQAIEVKQPGFDMYYHQLFREQMALRKTAENDLAMAHRVVENKDEELKNAVRIGCENITRRETADAKVAGLILQLAAARADLVDSYHDHSKTEIERQDMQHERDEYVDDRDAWRRRALGAEERIADQPRHDSEKYAQMTAHTYKIMEHAQQLFEALCTSEKDRDDWKRDSLMWSKAWERDQVHAENKALKGTAYAARLIEAMNKAARKICVKCREGVLLCGKPGTYRHESTADDRCRAEAIWLARDEAASTIKS